MTILPALPIESWEEITTPLVVFLSTLIITFWIRRLVYNRLRVWVSKARWEGG